MVRSFPDGFVSIKAVLCLLFGIPRALARRQTGWSADNLERAIRSCLKFASCIQAHTKISSVETWMKSPVFNALNLRKQRAPWQRSKSAIRLWSLMAMR